MPRPKKTPDYVEGPQAFENFRNLASQIVRAGRPTAEIVHTETDEATVTIQKKAQHVVGRAIKKRRR